MTQSAENAVQRGPIEDWLQSHGAEWRVIGDTSFVIRIASDNADRRAMESLGLCDMSGLRKLGLKGHHAEGLLRNANLDVPAKIFESCPLPDGGLTIRFGSAEFFLESGIRDEVVATIAQQFDRQNSQAFHVEHQEATFLLTGAGALAVLSQTCGINFRESPPRNAIFTRVAGVSCCVLPDRIGEIHCYRIWIDPSYALYLWEILVKICESLGGSAIGAGCLFPELIVS